MTSPSFIRGLYAPEMQAAIHVLLEFTVPSNSAIAINLVNNTQSVTHNGNSYSPFPFDIVLNHEDENDTGRVQLQVDNVDRRLGDLFMSLTEAPFVKVKIVLSTSPDVVEFELPKFRLVNVTITKNKLTGEFIHHEMVVNSYPPLEFTPSGFPGLFK